MFTVTLGFTSDPEKPPVILAGPDVPYQKQEEDMNAAAIADQAPQGKGKDAIVRVEIWRGRLSPQVFTFQDPAVKEMLLQQQRESQARAEEAAEAHRLTQIANLETEIARLKGHAAEDNSEVEAEAARLAEEAEAQRIAEETEAKRIADEDALKAEEAKKAEKEAKELKDLEDEIAAEAEAKAKKAAEEKAKPKSK